MSTIFGTGYSTLMNGPSLLDVGRRINRSGIGMSTNSRQMLESFYNNSSAIFNQLYTRTENAEVTNVMKIKALRSQYSYLVKGGPFDEANNTVTPSSNGTTLDTRI